MRTVRLAQAYQEAIWVALALQVPIALLLLLILDDGTMARIGAYAMVGFWCGTAVIMLRRPENPSRADLFYIRWGYAGALIVAFGIAAMTVGVRGG